MRPLSCASIFLWLHPGHSSRAPSAAGPWAGPPAAASEDVASIGISKRVVGPLVALALISPVGIRAQIAAELGTARPAPLLPHSQVPEARAVRLEGGIQLDGRQDEAAWARAVPLTRFTQLDPYEGQAVSEATEVRFLYDDEALFIGATLLDSEPVTSRLARRDAGILDSDFLVVLIDAYHDHQTAYRFATNPSGVKQDGIVSNQAGGRGGAGGDPSWDPVWEVAALITEDGWLAEMRIPLSQLRFSPDADQTWGVQVERWINRNQETAVFSFTPKLERGGIPRYGHLTGINTVGSGRKLEVLPYVGLSAEYVQHGPGSQVEFKNPFRSGSDYFGRAGVDLKYRLGSNLTLDATINPDFGQVEVDPAVINLSAFETRFQERRPFFVEGADIFQFARGGSSGTTGPPPQVLYSRRIGRGPQGSVSSAAAFADAPTSTTILGAAKVTGRVGSGWLVGVLEALTGRESAPWVDDTGSENETVVEPPTNYFAGRLRRDLRSGETQIGVMATTVHRDVAGTDLGELLPSSAYVGGVDLFHEWADRTWHLNAALVSSHIAGSEAAMVQRQRSSARYFQRPDATHVRADSTSTSLTGYYAMVDLGKQAGSVQGKLALVAEGAGYEVNDIGFHPQADRLIVSTDLSYVQPSPGDHLRSWRAGASPDFVWNSVGDRLLSSFNASYRWQWLNYWGGSVRVQHDFPTLDDRLTRGGPLARSPGVYYGNVTLNSDSRRDLSVRGRYDWRAGEEGERQNTGSVDFSYSSGENLQLGFAPSVTRSYSAAQYVTTVGDELAANTFGRRYIFAPIEQTTVSLETRLNVTVSPTLTIELYLQPLISSGQYGGLKELRAPRTFEFLRYGEETGTILRQEDGTYLVDPDGTGAADAFAVDDEDFSLRSLLGNAVLRWEWSPGSTLFLVWQQTRSMRLEGSQFDAVGARGTGDFNFRDDSAELFKLPPDNIFLVKVAYWLNL